MGFGARITTILAPAENLFGRHLISPLRHEHSDRAVTAEHLESDIKWCLMQARDQWGSWSTPGNDGKPALRALHERMMNQEKIASRTTLMLKMEKVGLEISKRKVRFFRWERAAGGWGSLDVDEVQVEDFPSATPEALKKLAARFAVAGFPFLAGAPPSRAAASLKREKA